MGSPIVVRGEVVGLFSLDSAQKDFYGPEHLAMIAPFARQAAIAVENAKLFADVEELERVKSQMIRIASHDLRSPLARIQLVIRQLEDQIHAGTTSTLPRLLRLSAEQTESLNTIRDSAREMEQIISDILSLERIETSIHTSEPIHWCEMVERCVNTLQNELKAKNHKLQINCALDLPGVRGSVAQLEHAILNMINNAIKYTPPDGEIEISVYPKMYGERPTIAVEVKDNGIGIPADQQALLFEPFYRVRQAGTENIPGAGMGLSVVKAAVEYHKGRVYVDSAPGEGSLFGFWIPV
jgi:two-component system sensor histidine kinase KdpD